jgi:hypothetical protein
MSSELPVTDRLDRLERVIRGLSKRVKVYGAIVTLGAVAAPVYGQIRQAYAEPQLRQLAREEINLILRQSQFDRITTGR